MLTITAGLRESRRVFRMLQLSEEMSIVLPPRIRQTPAERPTAQALLMWIGLIAFIVAIEYSFGDHTLPPASSLSAHSLRFVAWTKGFC